MVSECTPINQLSQQFLSCIHRRSDRLQEDAPWRDNLARENLLPRGTLMALEGSAGQDFDRFMAGLVKRNPGELEFHQAVQEVAESLIPFILDHPEYKEAQILERMTEPDRVVICRVPWEDDAGNVRANRAWRVQFNNSIGPYKGGMRFHPSVTLSVLKFLGFEQTFKNSLTTLPMGGGKGGANFNPKGKSDREVMRFCHSLMIELHRHIGPETDVPAGDIGVGAREISYMFGQYKRLANRFAAVLTGKGISFGGSLGRVEATGYGCVYFMQEMLARRGDSVEGKTCVVSGSGNVALHTIKKLDELGAKPITASDSGGFVHDAGGIGGEKLAWLTELKTERRGRISEYAEKFDVEYVAGGRPWGVPCDLAFPCATQKRSASKMRARCCPTGSSELPKAPTCRRSCRGRMPSPRRRSSMPLRRLPTPAASRSAAWSKVRTPCVSRGRRRR